MSLAVSLISVLAFAFIFQKPLKHFPVFFYVLTVLICVGVIFLTNYSGPTPILIDTILMAFQKAHVGFAFFVFVMYIGVFPKNSRIHAYFLPVRDRLSIIAGIFIMGHISLFAGNYMGYISNFFSLRLNTMSSLIIALIMLVLLVPLFITSFTIVRKKMKARTWDNLQKLAYPFFGLIYLHLLGFLLPSSLAGNLSTLISVVIYSVIFFLYFALRLMRFFLDRKTSKKKAV